MSEAAERYAKAMFQAERDPGQMALCVQVLTAPAVARHLNNPSVRTGPKLELLRQTLEDQLSPRFLNFLLLVVENGRQNEIAEIAAEYRRLCLEAQDVVSAELRYAVPLAEGDIDRLKDFLCRRYHKSQAQLALVQDPALIGGFQLRVGDQMYDQSYRNALRQLKERLQSR